MMYSYPYGMYRPYFSYYNRHKLNSPVLTEQAVTEKAKEEKQEQYAIAPQKKGVMILSVLPNSPAEKMGLTVGEIIVRVNAQEVNSEKELYEALQINAAHCKLEVLDHQGEIRLTQHVVHRNDNHKIGVVLIH